MRHLEAAGGFLDVVGHADAGDFAARLGRGGAGFEALPIGALHGVVHVVGELAAVEHAAGREFVGHVGGLDEVLAAQFGGVEFEFGGCFVDQALDHVGRFRAAGAAIGIDRHGVREDAFRRRVERRDRVDADLHAGGRHRRHERREVGEMAAHRRGRRCADGQ